MKKNNFCTIFGSEAFSKKLRLSKDAYNLTYQNLFISSVGFGMYKGAFDYKGRKFYQKLIEIFINNGVNVFDCARKYRNGFTELDLGIKINELIKKKKIHRDQIFVSSKAGLINFYQDKKKNIGINEFMRLRGLQQNDIKNNIFCASKKFLEQEINISLKNLKMSTLDNYYIHNPEFLEGNVNQYKDYYKVFETFEKAVQDNKIKSYGISSWTGFRRHKNSPFYIDLKRIIEIVHDIAGKKNNFKNLQAPLSICMPFSFVDYSFGRNENLVNFCKQHKINLFSSASLYEGKIEEFFNLLNIFSFLNNKKNINRSIYNDYIVNKISLPLSDNSILQMIYILEKISKKKKKFPIKFDKNIYKKSLNFVRSNPFISSSLFGVENISQLRENLSTLRYPKLNALNLHKIWKQLS